MDFFVSDVHFNHAAIMEFDHRPFATVEEMNAALIKNWNERVSEKDTVYILGDLMWTIDREESLRILRSINGHLILIRGNHDGRWLHGDDVRARFERIEYGLDIRVRDRKDERRFLSLSHYPMHFYNHAHRDGLMFYGHVHASPEYDEVRRIAIELNGRGVPCKLYNVFIGLYNWAPATFDEVIARGDADLEQMRLALNAADGSPADSHGEGDDIDSGKDD
jgi:calcineurin-like phosphoesterase family protein